MTAKERIKSYLSPEWHPIDWIYRKLEAIAIKIAGLAVQLLMLQNPIAPPNSLAGWFLKKIDLQVPTEPSRIQASLERLQNVFGATVTNQPNKAISINITATSFFASIEQAGGEIIEHNGTHIICKKAQADSEPYQNWIQALEMTFDWAARQTANGPVVDLPQKPPDHPDQAPFLFICPYFAQRGFEKKLLGFHLLSGCSVYAWLHPWYLRDQVLPLPTESSIHEIAKRNLITCQNQNQLPMNRIYAAGRCSGAAIAAELKKNHHAEGLHFIAINTFHNFAAQIEKETSQRLGKTLAKKLRPWAIRALQPVESEDATFNIASKLQSIRAGGGKTILVSTLPDGRMCEEATNELQRAGAHLNPPLQTVLWNKPHDVPHRGHSLLPFVEDLDSQKQYLNYLFQD